MKQKLKDTVVRYINEKQDAYIELGRDLFNHPELGFREVYTSNRVVEELDALGLVPERTARTGVVACLDTGKPGRQMGIIAEIDALYLPGHPNADPETGAAHVCGHHIQTAALIGVARALIESGAWQELEGSVHFFACPAEEGNVPASLYEDLKREGFKSSSGKQEMIARGHFDAIEGLLCTHALINDEKVTEPALLSAGCNGYNTWIFELQGRTAHPTMDPSKGVNALNGAMLALHAIQCVKDSLPLDDYSIIIVSLEELSQAPGAIPDYARLRMTTKSKSPAILEQIDEKVLNAVRGAALSVGCELKYEKKIGYQSFVADKALSEVYMKNCQALTGREVPIRPHGYYSNDLGDVAQLVPTSQIVVGGFTGALHSERFRIDDERMAYTLPAKIMASTMIDLLYPGD